MTEPQALPTIHKKVKLDKLDVADNFTMAEVLVTDYRELQYRIDQLTPGHWINLGMMANRIMQPLRDAYGRIRIHSWIRSPELNRHPKIQGAKESRHMLALAVDWQPIDIPILTVWEMIIKAQKNRAPAWDRLCWYPYDDRFHIDTVPIGEEKRGLFYIDGADPGREGWHRVTPLEAMQFAAGFRKERRLVPDQAVQWVDRS